MRLVAWALALAACAKSAPPPEPPTPVKIATVEAARIPRTAEYLATLKSRRSVTLQPQIDGQVTRIFVSSGDAVKQGDPIDEIDPARQEALVTSEQATRTAREATLQYRREQAERLAVLHEGGAVSRQELDQAKSALASAQAELASLEAQVRQQQVQLRYYRVTAPAAGIIGDVPVRVGDRVTPLTTLTTLSQNLLLEAYISVPVERAGELRLDLPVRLAGSDGAALAEAKVSFISPLVNEETQSVLVKALLPNPAGALRAGQFLRASIVLGEHQGPAVPLLAVVRLGGQHFAYVVEGADKGLVVRQRAIAVGEITGDRYAVTAGLKPGERIVVSGVQKLRDGAAVTPGS